MKHNTGPAADTDAFSGNGSNGRMEGGPRDIAAPAPVAQGFQRILIVRLGSMGDIIHSLPAVAILRRAFPQARIDWVIEERWAELAPRVDGPLDSTMDHHKLS